MSSLNVHLNDPWTLMMVDFKWKTFKFLSFSTFLHFHFLVYKQMKVCEELNCSEVVFPLSVNYLDRFLSIAPVKKCHLQLLGGVCLLIASKLRQCKSLHPQDLVFYSDNSFSISDVTVSQTFCNTLLLLRLPITNSTTTITFSCQ